MGPLGRRGFPLLGFAPRVGPIPPSLGWRTSPPWGLVPHGGGEEDGTPPLAYIRRGTPPFSNTTKSLFHSFSFLEVDSPCLESAPGLEFSTIGRPSLCRSREPNPSFFR